MDRARSTGVSNQWRLIVALLLLFGTTGHRSPPSPFFSSRSIGGGVFMDNGGSAVYAPPETYDDGAGANDGGYDGANDGGYDGANVGENDGYDDGTSIGVDPAAHGADRLAGEFV